MLGSLPRSKWRYRPARNGWRVAVSPSTGLTSNFATAFTCASDEVALIDKIVFSGISKDAASGETVTLEVNGVELPFHFPGEADRRATFRHMWRLNGNMVVQPGQSLKAKGESRATLAFGLLSTVDALEVHYRVMKTQQAITEGYLQGGTMPNVASLDWADVIPGTATRLIAGVAGRHIQVLGMAFTGHAYAAAEHNSSILFWDGAAGTTSGLFKAYSTNADAQYSPMLFVGDTDGCIQGPSGEGLYVNVSSEFGTLYCVAYDNEAAGPFTAGETLTFAGGGTATLVTLVDLGGDGVITFRMISGAVPANNEGITGGSSSATGDVYGTPNQVFYCDYDTLAVATFSAGEVLTFSGGDTALCISDVNSGAYGRFYFSMIGGTSPPASAETVSGGTSGATAALVCTPSIDNTKGDYVVLYRYIEDSDVGDTTGKLGQTIFGSRFWVQTETDPIPSTGAPLSLFGGYSFAYNTLGGGSFAVGDLVTLGAPVGTAIILQVTEVGAAGTMVLGPLISGAAPVHNTTLTVGGVTAAVNGDVKKVAISSDNNLHNVQIIGHAASFSTTNPSIPNTTGLGIGATSSALPIVAAVPLIHDGSAGSASTSHTYYDEDLGIEIGMNFLPGITGTYTGAATTISRSVLVWGRLGNSKLTGSSPANIVRFA